MPLIGIAGLEGCSQWNFVMVDGLSRREAAKRFGVHRNTIPKMLGFSVPPGYRRCERPASKKLGPYMAWIDAGHLAAFDFFCGVPKSILYDRFTQVRWSIDVRA